MSDHFRNILELCLKYSSRKKLKIKQVRIKDKTEMKLKEISTYTLLERYCTIDYTIKFNAS